MKKSKIIAPALGVLILSTAASISGTVAWFTANSTIDVTGLQMKAKAENGMVASSVASPSAAGDWLAAVTVANTGANKEFLPTSTADGTNWYHAVAGDINSAAKTGNYEALTLNNDGTGCYAIRSGEEGSYTYSSPYYLYNEIKFQASAGTAITGQDIYVTDLAASVVGGTATSAALDKALRVGFIWGNGTLKIYNALDSDTTSFSADYDNNAQTAATQVTSVKASTTTGVTTSVIAENQTLAAYAVNGANATTLKVFCWFEGEDENCKSVNLAATLDQLSISFTIGTKNHPQA